MFNFFTRKSVTAAPMPNDTPDHAGFRVTHYHNGLSTTVTRRTLKEAQVAVARQQADSRSWAAGLASRGVVSGVKHRWTIQNLESGRFCAYSRTVTRDEMRAA